MAIDPNLANAILNPKQFQMPDPMEGMGQALTNAMLIEKMNGLRQERADNAMLNEIYKTTGGDRAKMRTEVINRGQGSRLPAMEKSWWEADKAAADVGKTTADAAKTKADTLKSKQESVRALFAPYMNSQNITAQQMYDVMGAVLNDPDIGGWYAEMKMTPEMVKQGIDHAAQNGQLPMFARAMGMTADKALEQTYHVIQEKDKQTLVGSNKYGTPNAAVAGTYGAKPEAGTTINIDNRAADAYTKKAMEIQAEDDANLRKAAEAGPGQLQSLDELISILPDAYTGKTANILGTGSAWFKAAGGEPNEKALVATQKLKMGLSENSLKNIATMWQEGVKLGAVTKPEFDQLMASVPQITDDPAVIKAWLLSAKDGIKRTIERNQARQGQITGDAKLGDAIGNIVPPPPQLPPAPLPTYKSKRGNPIPEQALRDLLAAPNTAAFFDEHFGVPGLAQRILKEQGGAPNGGRPFQ